MHLWEDFGVGLSQWYGAISKIDVTWSYEVEVVLESVYIANRTSHSSLGEITPYSNNKSASVLSAEHYSTRSTKGRRCSKGPMKKSVSMQLLPGPGVFTIRRQKNRSKLGTPVYKMHRTRTMASYWHRHAHPPLYGRPRSGIKSRLKSREQKV